MAEGCRHICTKQLKLLDMIDKEELEVFMADWNTLLPIELKGTLVKLVPLNLSHADNLKEAISDGQLNNLWYTNIPSEEGIEAEIERRLQSVSYTHLTLPTTPYV